jgi:hypothetical protein
LGVRANGLQRPGIQKSTLGANPNSLNGPDALDFNHAQFVDETVPPESDEIRPKDFHVERTPDVIVLNEIARLVGGSSSGITTR